MNHYSNAELTDIHFVYGLGHGNGRAAVRLYGERYPTRRQQNLHTLTQVHQNFAKHGSFRVMIECTGRPRTACTPIFEKGVCCMVWNKINTSVRVLAVATGRS
ncbi:hypothetical protein TNCV_3889561 [Trichonephila clavipes]|nr:hypothetical protein TNCV_3889561 [Trichonephila clavipes]